LPLIVTGTSTETGATAPPSTLSSPLVAGAELVPLDPVAVDGAGATVVASELVESPTMLTAFPVTATGTDAEVSTTFPDPMPSSPEVDGAVGAGDDEDATGAELEPPVRVSPSPLIALPASETGTLRLMPSTSPEPAPSVPLVEGSAALAAPIPASDRPPRMTVNHSPLDTILFMIQLPEE
jgi:hypothetical protein